MCPSPASGGPRRSDRDLAPFACAGRKGGAVRTSVGPDARAGATRGYFLPAFRNVSAMPPRSVALPLPPLPRHVILLPSTATR